MKIAIVGLVCSENLGESFIAQSLSWLIRDAVLKLQPELKPEFVWVDLAGKRVRPDHSSATGIEGKSLFDGYDPKGALWDRIDEKIKRLSRRVSIRPARNTISRLRHSSWLYRRNGKKRLLNYYQRELQGVNLIAIDGAGLLEYSYNEYQEYLLTLMTYAEGMNIPVICNAIGRAGEFDPADYRCKILMRAMQSEQLRYVSARDSVESVQACVGDRLKVKLLADAAFWASEAYGVTAQPGSDTIGVGLIRGTAFQSYEEGLNEEKLIDFFIQIGAELEHRGYRYEYFTNGLSSDQRFGQKLIEKAGLDQSKLVDRPTKDTELIHTISGYRGLITCRMHSSIVAFSMGIPSVILSWNEKVNKYMAQAGYPERAVSMKEMDPSHTVDILERALREGVSEENRNRMKELAQESVEDYADLLTSPPVE